MQHVKTNLFRGGLNVEVLRLHVTRRRLLVNLIIQVHLRLISVHNHDQASKVIVTYARTNSPFFYRQHRQRIG